MAHDSTAADPVPSPDQVDEITEAWRRERPATPVESIQVITRITRLAKLFADDRRRTLSQLGIDSATLDLLATLRRAGPPYQLSPGQLAQRALVSAGAVSQRVTRAQRSGLVTRQPAGGDGRGVLVTLTAAGHALVERTVDELLRHEETLLAPLTAPQRKQLAATLRALLTQLSAGHSEPPAGH